MLTTDIFQNRFAWNSLHCFQIIQRCAYLNRSGRFFSPAISWSGCTVRMKMLEKCYGRQLHASSLLLWLCHLMEAVCLWSTSLWTYFQHIPLWINGMWSSTLLRTYFVTNRQDRKVLHQIWAENFTGCLRKKRTWRSYNNFLNNAKSVMHCEREILSF